MEKSKNESEVTRKRTFEERIRYMNINENDMNCLTMDIDSSDSDLQIRTFKEDLSSKEQSASVCCLIY